MWPQKVTLLFLHWLLWNTTDAAVRAVPQVSRHSPWGARGPELQLAWQRMAGPQHNGKGGAPVTVRRVTAASWNCLKKGWFCTKTSRTVKEEERGGGGEAFFRQNTCLRVIGETPHAPQAELRLPKRMKNADIATKQWPPKCDCMYERWLFYQWAKMQWSQKLFVFGAQAILPHQLKLMPQFFFLLLPSNTCVHIVVLRFYQHSNFPAEWGRLQETLMAKTSDTKIDFRLVYQ